MLRRSLLAPIPEFALAADLLSSAADALLAPDRGLRAELLMAADLPQLRAFSYRVAGPIDQEIHRQSKNPSFVPVPRANPPRMPNAAASMVIMVRDGFRCRFCEARVITKEARRIFVSFVPQAARSGKATPETISGCLPSQPQ
jgi:hypothetical protein